ncbi:MAG: hypothetical protein IPG09_13595 [Ignavibacteria bacterium]|nr:hypothetical protein [Ignavibacteria bacterium]
MALNYTASHFKSVLNNLLIIVLFCIVLAGGKSALAQDHSEENKKTETTHVSTDEGKFDIIDRVVDHHYVDFYFLGKLPLPHFEPVNILGITFDFSVTKTLFMIFVSSILLILVLMYVAS